MSEFKNKEVKCRKKHNCSWCGEIIEIGEKAQHRVGKYYGDFYSDYFHPECNEAILKSELLPDEEYQAYEQQRGKTFEESHF